MNWEYGIVKTQIKGEDWYYLAEVYEDNSHTSVDYLGGISGSSVEEVQEIIEMIYEDLKKPTVVKEIRDDN
jgi:hypothetical protein